jgi:hypothetical protein
MPYSQERTLSVKPKIVSKFKNYDDKDDKSEQVDLGIYSDGGKPQWSDGDVGDRSGGFN